VYAGDVCEAPHIVEKARSRWYDLADQEQDAEIGKDEPTDQHSADDARFGSLENIEAAICQAYRDRFAELITGKYLSRYGFSSLDEFRKGGRDQLGDHVFSGLCDEIDRFDLETDFIVYGFSRRGMSRMFEVKNPGYSTNRDALGYWAVGSGSVMALASLTGRKFQQVSIPEVIYRLCEAKFCAETASGVGKDTFVVVTNKHEQQAVIRSDEVIKHLRSIWDRTRNVQPAEAFELIKDHLPLEP
jgi:hypothetical protein